MTDSKNIGANRTKQLFSAMIEGMRVRGMDRDEIVAALAKQDGLSKRVANQVYEVVVLGHPLSAERVATIQVILGGLGFVASVVISVVVIALWNQTTILTGRTSGIADTYAWMLIALITSAIFLWIGARKRERLDPFSLSAWRWSVIRFFVAVTAPVFAVFIFFFFTAFAAVG